LSKRLLATKTRQEEGNLSPEKNTSKIFRFLEGAYSPSRGVDREKKFSSMRFKKKSGFDTHGAAENKTRGERVKREGHSLSVGAANVGNIL